MDKEEDRWTRKETDGQGRRPMDKEEDKCLKLRCLPYFPRVRALSPSASGHCLIDRSLRRPPTNASATG